MKFREIIEEQDIFNPADPDSTPLYHGSDSENFDQYDLSKMRTAAHIYTTVEPEAALGYGKYLYRAHPRAGLKYLDLSPYNDIDYRALAVLYKEMAIEEDYEMDLEAFAELVTSGRVYDFDLKGYFQDEMMNTVASMGYDALIWVDSAPGNRYMETVVFFHPGDVRFERLQ